METQKTVTDFVTQTGNYIANRDIIISKTKIRESKNEFIEIDLNYFNSRKYVEPIFIDDVINNILKNRLILISGNYGFDKSTLIKYLAYLIQVKDKSYSVKEWISNSNLGNFFYQLAIEKKPSIIVINQINPQNINYNFQKFAREVKQGKHFVIASTDNPIETWKFDNESWLDYIFDIPSSNIYSEIELQSYAVEKLKESKEDLFGADNSSSELNVIEIVKHLQSPEKIDFLINKMNRKSPGLSSDGILELIHQIQASSNKELLYQWYNTLSEKEKLLIVSFVLFDGLYDDQYFSTLKILVDDFWKKRDNSLESVDYCDVEKLMNFYKFDLLDEQRRVLKGKFVNQRFDLLNIIWGDYRRLLFSSLESMLKILRYSVYYPSYSWDLFGNQERIDRIQNVIIQTLSDIGRISPYAIENVLIELASEDAIELQSAAAKIMARWREFNLENQLFDTLDNWHNETRIKSIFDELSEKKKENENTNTKNSKRKTGKLESKDYSRSYIRSTIALTLGYASQYDSPGKMNNKIFNLIKLLSEDDDNYIQNRLNQITIPLLCNLHLAQIKDYLFDLSKNPTYSHSIALSLALTYFYNPEGIYLILQEWYNYSQKNVHLRGNSNQFTERDMIVSTLILTLSEIKYIDQFSKFKAEQVYDFIKMLYERESQPKFRKYYVYFAEEQIYLNFSHLSKNVLDYLMLIALNQVEISIIIGKIADVYIKERSELTGGQSILRINQKLIPIWIDQERPFTRTEQILFEWLGSKNEIAQNISFLSFIEFAKRLDLQEHSTQNLKRGIKFLGTDMRSYEISQSLINKLNDKLPKNVFEVLEKLVGVEFKTSYIYSAKHINELLNSLVPEEIKDVLSKLDGKEYQTTEAFSKALNLEIETIYTDRSSTDGVVSFIFSVFGYPNFEQNSNLNDLITQNSIVTGKEKLINKLREELNEEDFYKYEDLIFNFRDTIENEKPSMIERYTFDSAANLIFGREDQDKKNTVKNLFRTQINASIDDQYMRVVFGRWILFSKDSRSLSYFLDKMKHLFFGIKKSLRYFVYIIVAIIFLLWILWISN